MVLNGTLTHLQLQQPGCRLHAKGSLGEAASDCERPGERKRERSLERYGLSSCWPHGICAPRRRADLCPFTSVLQNGPESTPRGCFTPNPGAQAGQDWGISEAKMRV